MVFSSRLSGRQRLREEVMERKNGLPPVHPGARLSRKISCRRSGCP